MGLRLTDGCDVGIHPDDIEEHRGTPLGDMLEGLQAMNAVSVAQGLFIREQGKGIGAWFRRLFK